MRERRPLFSPEQVCGEFAEVLKSYGLAAVTSDRFGGEWVVEQFGKFGVLCKQCAKPKSDLYADVLALLNSRRIDLLDDRRLFCQLVALERSTGRSGRDIIDHPPSGHDDCINAVAGAASQLLVKGRYNLNSMGFDDDPTDNDPGIEAHRAKRYTPERPSETVQQFRSMVNGIALSNGLWPNR